MDEIYTKLTAAFAKQSNIDRFTAKGLKPPKIIDFYQGQPEDPENFEFVLPALFVDYRITSWTLQGKIYVGSANIQIHAIPEDAPSASNISRRMTEGLKPLQWYGLVRQVIDTITGETFSMLQRGPEDPLYTRDYVYHVLNFTCNVDDIPGTEVDRYADGTIEDLSITGNPVKFQL